jgi:thioredoxin reductase (NADPH)
VNHGSVLVLGAGPAGMSAALWLRNLGLDFLVLEAADRPGGMQNFNFLANDWVLGQTGMTGPQLAEHFSSHLRRFGAQLATGARLDRIETLGNGFIASFDDVTRQFDAILIATGTRYRAEEMLSDVPGFAMLHQDRIAYGPHAFANMDALRGQSVLVMGGGDNAHENARFLAAEGATAVLAARSRPRAQKALMAAVDELVKQGRCRIVTQTRITRLHETEGAIEVELRTAENVNTMTVDRIHVLTGYEPNTFFIPAAFQHDLAAGIGLDAQGYVRIDSECRTGQARIYAAGDVANPVFPCVVSAVAQGAMAAKTIERDLRERFA